MSKKRYQNMRDDGSDYTRGYQDGMNAAFDNSELDAYYAGVGFGKYAAGDKHLGFNSAEEKAEFEKGITNKDNHFKSYRAQPLTLWERVCSFFFGSKSNPDKINYQTRRDRKRSARKDRRASRKANKASRKASRYQKRNARKSKRGRR